jgi:inosine/xanthosine triphosphatase
MKIAVGSENAAKLAAARAAAARIGACCAAWAAAEVVGASVAVSVPAMPLCDDELMRGARERAEKALAAVQGAQLGIGLEGGFHTMATDGANITFLRGWAYATDGARGFYGAAPAITVPPAIARRVIESGRELAAVIDEAAGQQDVRSRQGAWGVFSCDALTRAQSFEAAIVAACAPFYNPEFYDLV